MQSPSSLLLYPATPLILSLEGSFRHRLNGFARSAAAAYAPPPFCLSFLPALIPPLRYAPPPPTKKNAANYSRHPSPNARKLSLGLLSPSELAESGPTFFSDVVALLSEAEGAPSSSVGDRSSDCSSAGSVLNLCALLAKVGLLHHLKTRSVFCKSVPCVGFGGPLDNIEQHGTCCCINVSGRVLLFLLVLWPPRAGALVVIDVATTCCVSRVHGSSAVGRREARRKRPCFPPSRLVYIEKEACHARPRCARIKPIPCPAPRRDCLPLAPVRPCPYQPSHPELRIFRELSCPQDPGCRACLAGQGAAAALSRVVAAPPTSLQGGERGGLRVLAVEVGGGHGDRRRE